MELLVLGNQVYEVAAIDILADLDAAEILREVRERHPEGPVVGVFGQVDLLFESRCPAFGVVAPVSLPLEVAPGVSQLN